MSSDDISKSRPQHDQNVVDNFNNYLADSDGNSSRLLQHQLKAESSRRTQFAKIVCWGLILVFTLYTALIAGVAILLLKDKASWELVAIMSFAFGLPAYSVFYTLTRATRAPFNNSDNKTPSNKNEDDYISNQALQDGAKLVEKILKAAKK